MMKGLILLCLFRTFTLYNLHPYYTDKGMGLIIPVFIPGTWGDVAEFTPTLIEIGIITGVYAL